MKTRKNLRIVLVTLFLMVASFFAGSSFKMIKEAKASTTDAINFQSVRYEKVYAYGHNYIVFRNASYSDIEVIQLD